MMADEEVHSIVPSHGAAPSLPRSNSMSQPSDAAYTAQDFINSQLQLEADAREALPYQFDSCTRPLGALRQLLFSCLTCNPPPASPSEPYTAAGICYSCSIACHGEHTLVELFNKRNFVCDCGTSRIQTAKPCSLRTNEPGETDGEVASKQPAANNRYNQNFANRFCGCGEEYNAHEEKGTMYQCLGLGNVEDGGCGEDWWHPECILGMTRKPSQNEHLDVKVTKAEETLAEVQPHETADVQEPVSSTVITTSETVQKDAQGEVTTVPPGFPDEDDFDQLLCYKCVDANPWIRRYAGAPGFLPPVLCKPVEDPNVSEPAGAGSAETIPDVLSKKRKAEDEEQPHHTQSPKRQHTMNGTADHAPVELVSSETVSPCSYATLPEDPKLRASLFLKEDFREHMCRCAACFPLLKPFPQLLEEEDTYEPPISEDGDAGTGAHSVGTGSLLDRGEAALSNVDRVRAIEGVMVYNHLKDKVKSFLQPFADSGQAVGADDIKSYFEKLRGDADAMKAAAAAANGSSIDDGKDNRKEQGGY